MGNRHKFKRGGAAMSGRDDYTGSGEPNVVKEAKAKKGGGGVNCGTIDGRKSGGRIKKARGGGVGADNHPFSSAYRASTEAK